MKILSLFAAVALSCSSLGAAQTTTVTYITKVQEERKSTRWTLTEWLRIKERMKLMDVWLAMFSSPEKDKFSPELRLAYLSLSGEGSSESDDGTPTDVSSEATDTSAQLWLTNIFSATTGIRALNIELGLQYTSLAMTQSVAGDGLAQEVGSEEDTTFYGAGFRIFGKNIQDSSLVLHYGEYNHEDGAGGVLGNYLGAEMDLYLFRWLGLTGQYWQFQNAKARGTERSGTYYKYGPYIEISVLRIFGGQFVQEWELNSEGATVEQSTRGTFVGGSLNF